ncbi:MAG: FG-GAP repeat protein, partial [Planctomycetes bacterium]|nr:FG-GAP repeat protein [Planctomycetota bacterium]
MGAETASRAVFGQNSGPPTPVLTDADTTAGVLSTEFSTANETVKLIASDAQEGAHFGSVALYGDVLAVGAYRDDDLGSNAGAVYVYRRSGTVWVEEAKLTVSDGAPSEGFGIGVAMSENVIFANSRDEIPSCPEDDPICDAGSVYVFRFDGSEWVEEARLMASDPVSHSAFGSGLSAEGSRLVVGAPQTDGMATYSGAGYIFSTDGTTWTEEAKISASDGEFNDQFGRAVAIHGGILTVGASKDDDAGQDAGAIYIHRLQGGTWKLEGKITASDAAPGDRFGSGLSINSGTLVV